MLLKYTWWWYLDFSSSLIYSNFVGSITVCPHSLTISIFVNNSSGKRHTDTKQPICLKWYLRGKNALQESRIIEAWRKKSSSFWKDALERKKYCTQTYSFSFYVSPVNVIVTGNKLVCLYAYRFLHIKNTTNVCIEANESSMQNHRMRSLYSNTLKAH